MIFVIYNRVHAVYTGNDQSTHFETLVILDKSMLALWLWGFVGSFTLGEI